MDAGARRLQRLDARSSWTAWRRSGNESPGRPARGIRKELGAGSGWGITGGISHKDAPTVLGAWTIDGKTRRFPTLLASINTRARRVLRRILL